MKKSKTKVLVLIAYLCLAIAIVSALTPIVVYTNRRGVERSFSVIDFLSDSDENIGDFVFSEFTGEVLFDYDNSILYILIGVGAFAVLCAIVGLILISQQKENTLSFVLTLFGLIGTMAPSLITLICVVALKDQYEGTIACGVYPILAPIAMVVCIIATTQMHRKNVKYHQKLREASGMVFRGGDL